MTNLPAPPAPENLLGCARQYQAAIHLRGGDRVYIPAAVLADSLIEVQWERRLNGTSTGRIVLAKQHLARECCAVLGTVEPWCHELSVYRDEDLVWQGPVLRVTEEEAAITVDARDITAWLARLVNTRATNYPKGRDIALISQDVITGNLNWTTLAHPTTDWPRMLAYLSRVNAGVVYRLNRAGSIWTDTVLTIVQELADQGFEWTALGRRMLIRPEKTETKDRARARLVPEHLPGGISVIKDGEDAATSVFATSQTDTDPGVTVSVSLPRGERARRSCGRLDMLVRHNPRVEAESPAQQQRRRDAIEKKYDQREKAIRQDAQADLNRILEGPNTPTERKQAEARRRQRDEQIAVLRRLEAKERKESDDRIKEWEKVLTALALRQLATKTLRGRWPVPTVITVQSNARLSPDAPLTVDALVPGERVDVAAIGFCREVTQAMKLTQVRAQWGGQGGESIGISLTPLTETITEGP
ncbi:hypothetical protein [Streptomyces yaizuensis]|uniref:Uncharacterized protein n=1 Tax=Streptomyces yaizuensis TaxID=2989713 RepID=A0AA86MBH7_9ACTN|nr:hypothetical protein [Streptomyces sp. YSPA8]BDT39533.1 hypothetical protein SYYSPA8_37075 [Streptomyces sp. YSPA8]